MNYFHNIDINKNLRFKKLRSWMDEWLIEIVSIIVCIIRLYVYKWMNDFNNGDIIKKN